MKLVEINWTPTSRQLRQFGVVCLFALPLFGWLWRLPTTWTAALALVGAALAALGLVVPKALRPIFLALSLVALPIGMVLSEFALLLIFFGVFVPIGLVMRLIGRDALQLKLELGAKSYWRPKKGPRDAASYYRQS